jgi:hypothetical protein
LTEDFIRPVVAHQIDQSLQDRQPPARTIQVAVYDYDIETA